MSPHRITIVRALPMLAAVAIAAPLALAQPRPTGGKPAVKRGAVRRQEQAPIHLGNATLDHYTDATIIPGERYEVRGPNTHIEMLDPQVKGAVYHLRATHIIAFIKPKTNEAERVEATGNLQFDSSRPVEYGNQTVHGTGIKGTYYPQEHRMVIDGPVVYHITQPSSTGKATEMADGSAASARYDMEKQVVTLDGAVKIKATMPEKFDEPLNLRGDHMRIDLAKRPYEIQIHNDTDASGEIKLKPKQPEKKPEKS